MHSTVELGSSSAVGLVIRTGDKCKDAADSTKRCTTIEMWEKRGRGRKGLGIGREMEG